MFGVLYSIFLLMCGLAISVFICGPCCHGRPCLACIPDKELRSFFKKGPKYRLPSRIDLTKCGSIVEKALQTYCKRWRKKEGVGVHALNDLENEFLRILDIRIENFTTHPHLYKQPPSRSVKTKQQITSSLSEKDTNHVDVFKGELNSTSTHVPVQLTKDKLLLYHIDTLTKINITIDKYELPTFHWLPKLHKILLNHASYQILATALLPFVQSILHPL